MFIVNLISYILVLLGAVNWGLYGIFNFNLVSAIFMGDRSIGAIITYIVIAAAHRKFFDGAKSFSELNFVCN